MQGAIVVLFSCLFLASLVSGQINVFTASFTAAETQSGVTGTRSYHGTLYYSDNWQKSTNTGHEAIRMDIALNNGVTNTVLKQLEIFQDQFFRYTVCNGHCSWQDLFAQEPLPKLYIDTGDTPTQTNLVVNSQSVDEYVFSQTNAIGTNYPSFVTLYVSTGTPRFPVRAILKYSNGVTNQIDMTGWSQTVPESTWRVDAGCPIVQAGCFRLDVAVVIDVSGSVGNEGTLQEKNFLLELVQSFLIGPQYFGFSLSTFSYCNNANVQFRLTYDKQTLLNRIQNTNFVSEGWTCIVGGVQRGFWTFAEANGSRPATSKAMIIATDGNGNRPCGSVNVLQQADADCGTIDASTMSPCCASSCYGRNPCDGGSCCSQAHNQHLTNFYNSQYARYNPKIYAVGVTSAISDATLQLIVNDPAAIASGEPRIFRVDSWADINNVISALAAAVVCNVPGPETCPNDCRPGGFCCGGSCQCTQDCSLQSTECQLSVCQANRFGAGCVRGPPDDAACDDPNIQCQDRFCIVDVGCSGTANDNLTCTDQNACTIDFCFNGTCSHFRNDSVSQCDDDNPCTQNDLCLTDGKCRGTPNDNLPCDDGNLCTDDQCVGGVCVSVNKVCDDPDITDCKIPFCNVTNGECDYNQIPNGFQCLASSSEDFCTVFVCEDVSSASATDTQSAGSGQCVARTRDADECRSTSDATPAIIGGVIGGVAFIAIIIIAAVVLALILLKTAAPGLLGSINPFAGATNVSNAGTYVDPMSTGQSGIYEDPSST